MSFQNDSIQRFIFEHYPIRGEIVHLNDSFRTIMQQHSYPWVIQKLLGETLLSAVALAETIKFKGMLTIQFHGEGPIKLLVAKCNHARQIRGLAQWSVDALADEILYAMGAGSLVITIEEEDKINPYQSIVELHHKNITAALEFYFGQSEQLPTKLFSALTKDQASMVMLQMLPSDKAQDRENFWKVASQFQESITEDKQLRLPNAEILQLIYPNEEVRVFEPQSIAFHCTCSYPRMEEALRVLGESEAMDILKDKQVIGVTCEYCNSEFTFEKDEVIRIFSKEKK